MKRSLRSWCIGVGSVILVLAVHEGEGSGNNAVSRVVARVGDEVITTVELDQIYKPIARQIEENTGPEERAEQLAKAREAALKQLIDRKLLLLEANRMGVQLPEIEIEKQLDKIRGQYATEEDFRNFLEQQHMTEEELRKTIHDDLKVKVMFQDKVMRRVTVLPSEVHEYYQLHASEFVQPGQVHMYQILIKKRPDPLRARKRAEQVLAELKGGANFQQLARLRSEDPKREKGGDWGLVSEGFFGEEMAAVEKAAFALEPGQFSDIIETRYGYHIVYIDRKRPGRVLTEVEAYDEIYARLFQEKLAKVYDDYMQYLRDKTYVEVVEGSEGSGKEGGQRVRILTSDFDLP
ncbi:MAG: SurA N-terminal domain-containing protein [bacterium]|nr:SurA N-terminal domain-containing protein [bacterium]